MRDGYECYDTEDGLIGLLYTLVNAFKCVKKLRNDKNLH